MSRCLKGLIPELHLLLNNRGGGRGIGLLRPSEQNLDPTIIGPTKAFKM